ncbi:5' nucleotidase, NT5C type [Leifsonia aquatica]|uniref:5' nucleotidase, NT5C type n=1 Tax=Leifsonia aquatica TaxID=144185 RepID=UPI000468184F|nr:hypothetical protein [Leifsonia aquatica]
MTRVLVDLDDTIAHWNLRYDQGLEKYDRAGAIPRAGDMKQFNLYEGRSETEQLIISAVMNEPGFYRDLEPVDGAYDALWEMHDTGLEVFLVTSPWLSNPTCASDKLHWVRNFLGDDWAARTVITHDKTIVAGDILIDDKPKITGYATPSWQQVIFDQPHNQHRTDLVRLTNWRDWRLAILEVFGL